MIGQPRRHRRCRLNAVGLLRQRPMRRHEILRGEVERQRCLTIRPLLREGVRQPGHPPVLQLPQQAAAPAVVTLVPRTSRACRFDMPSICSNPASVTNVLLRLRRCRPRSDLRCSSPTSRTFVFPRAKPGSGGSPLGGIAPLTIGVVLSLPVSCTRASFARWPSPRRLLSFR